MQLLLLILSLLIIIITYIRKFKLKFLIFLNYSDLNPIYYYISIFNSYQITIFHMFKVNLKIIHLYVNVNFSCQVQSKIIKNNYSLTYQG